MSITEGPLRAGFYIDGFNLYHALDDLNKPYLKWLSLMTLAKRIANVHHAVASEVVFCTAFFPGDFAKRKRHEAYSSAQNSEGVRVLLGHTTKEPMSCKAAKCGHKWDQPREKETDINVARSLFDDARRDLFDVAFLISADTDQASTLKLMANCFPQKSVFVLTPPGRRKSQHLSDLAKNNILLSEADIDSCILPSMLQPETGRLITRPHEYAPPIGWLHRDDRKK